MRTFSAGEIKAAMRAHNTYTGNCASPQMVKLMLQAAHEAYERQFDETIDATGWAEAAFYEPVEYYDVSHNAFLSRLLRDG